MAVLVGAIFAPAPATLIALAGLAMVAQGPFRPAMTAAIPQLVAPTAAKAPADHVPLS